VKYLRRKAVWLHRTILYRCAAFLRGFLPALSRFSARTTPIRASMVGPFFSITNISASMASCHSGASCSHFGSFVMNVAASCRGVGLRPLDGGIGSSREEMDQ
jgi:hypothetical protein